MKLSETKECLRCHQVFPRTSDYFYFVSVKRLGGKKYPKPECKACSAKSQKDWRKKRSEQLTGKMREKQRVRQRRLHHTPLGVYQRLKKEREVLITKEEFIAWYNSQPRRCCYCGLEESRLPLDSDVLNRRIYRLTVDRMDNSRGYEKGNIVLCCLRCNLIKADFFTPSEMEEIGKKYIAMRWNQNA